MTTSHVHSHSYAVYYWWLNHTRSHQIDQYFICGFNCYFNFVQQPLQNWHYFIANLLIVLKFGHNCPYNIGSVAIHSMPCLWPKLSTQMNQIQPQLDLKFNMLLVMGCVVRLTKNGSKEALYDFVLSNEFGHDEISH